MSFISLLESHLSKISKPSMENPVYITTNETGLDQARKILTNMPPSANGAHIGVSGWHNYDIMAIRKPQHGILVDINKRQYSFNLLTLNNIVNSKDRKDFIKRMDIIFRAVEKRPYGVPPVFWSRHLHADHPDYSEITKSSELLANESHRIGSWLYDDESFEYIKEMAKEKRIFVVCANFEDTAFFEAIGKTLQAINISIDTLYTSNIHDYIPPAEAEKFKASIKALSQEKTQHIHTSMRHKLLQNIRKDTEPFDEVFGDAILIRDAILIKDDLFSSKNSSHHIRPSHPS